MSTTPQTVRWGRLYGMGVGPGDPELLTLKAVRILGEVDVVFAAASSKNDFSHSLAIAKPHLKPDVPTRRLPFPMTDDMALLESAWRENAHTVADVLCAGQQAAFLTIGDPMLYSTFGYLAQTLRKLYGETMPDGTIVSVPGIMSLQAAASKALMPLAEGRESLLIAPGVAGGEALEQAMATAGNVAVLKAYKNYSELRQTVEAAQAEAAAFTLLGQEGEAWSRELADLGETPHYMTLMLVKRRK